MTFTLVHAFLINKTEFTFCIAVWGLYSTMSEVDISVPANLPPTIPLVVVKTLPEGYASYGLDTERKDWIGMDRATGELKLASYKVFSDLATPTRSELNDLCFWRAVKFQVYENRPTTVLGPLGPQFVRRICPEHYAISYNITNGLDRDTRPDGNGTMGPGSEFRVHVSCVLDRGLSLPEEVSLVIPVSVLDEDDNPPVPQEASIRVTLNDSEIKEVSTNYSFIFDMIKSF
ncbi:hypothetical protein C0J52_06473 [Blattella germanica]|nr:hypothetical protein C0J52_06473 [Blattella germanica]